MYSVLTLRDLADFLQMTLFAFQDTLFMAFSLMITFTVAFQFRRLFVDGKG